MADAGARPRTPERRLLARASGTRSLLALGIACGFAAAVLVVAAAYLTSVVVADVFLGGATLASEAALLAAVAILALVRAPLLVVGDLLAQRAADRLKRRLRADLTGHLLALGPVYTGRERSGELAAVVVNGTETLDAWVTVFEPARILAVAVPLLVLAAIGAVDPPTVLVLLLTGPVLVLLLAFIGGRARTITERRFAELRWLSAFFLDMLQGLPTLKLFGRSAEQVDTIRDISRRYGDTTMEVLRTRVPDVARARMGRCGRRRPRRRRDQPSSDVGGDRLRSRAGRPHHRPRVLPAAADAGDPLSRGSRGPCRRRTDHCDPGRAGAVAAGAVGGVA